MGEGARLPDAATQPHRSRRTDFWWRHLRSRPEMWAALNGLSRYILTARVAKHRLFVWLNARVCPDSATIAIARDDDTTFNPAQPVSRAVVAPALNVGSGRATSALHAKHHLRDVPVPGRPDAERAGLELRGRAEGDRRRRGRPAARRAAGPVAQPAGMGRVGGRAGPRLSASGRFPATRPPRRRSRSAR